MLAIGQSMLLRLPAIVLLLTLLLPSCERPIEVYWEDDGFRVYGTHESPTATLLGYHNDPGIVGLVPTDVVSAGSNKEVVVVKRLGAERGSPEFYLINKETNSGSVPGSVRGPLTKEQFELLKEKQEIPDFSWTKWTQSVRP